MKEKDGATRINSEEEDLTLSRSLSHRISHDYVENLSNIFHLQGKPNLFPKK